MSIRDDESGDIEQSGRTTKLGRPGKHRALEAPRRSGRKNGHGRRRNLTSAVIILALTGFLISGALMEARNGAEKQSGAALRSFGGIGVGAATTPQRFTGAGDAASASPDTERSGTADRSTRGGGRSGADESDGPKVDPSADPGGEPRAQEKKKDQKQEPDVVKKSAAAEDAATTDEKKDGPPDFQLPFRCGERLELTTYVGHNPEDKKVDFFNDNGYTSGMPVVAPAAGRVSKLPDPGGVKIDHGNGWYTLYIHMQDRDVSVGQAVEQGDQIGLVGSVGTGVAHLHYELLHNPDGGEAYTQPNIVFPVFDGETYKLVPNTEPPRVTSANSC